MSSLYPCHESCSKELEKEIENIISKFHDDVKVETVVFKENDASEETANHYDGDATPCTSREVENFTHRFLITIVQRCPQDPCNSSLANSNEIIHIRSLEELLEGNDKVSAVFTLSEGFGFSAKASFTPLSHEQVDGEVINNIRFTETLDNEIGPLLLKCGNIGGTEDGGEPEPLTVDVLNLTNDDADDVSDGLFPLTTAELHDAINQQLDKDVPDASSWSSSLFKEVDAYCSGNSSPRQNVKTEPTSGSSTQAVNEIASLKSQQQSNEISSSTWDWDNIAVSSVHPRSTPLVHHTTFKDNCSGSDSFLKANKLSLAMSTSAQVLCPANLPAVSSFFGSFGNVGLSTNLTLASTGSKKNLQMNRSVHTKQARNRSLPPSLLLPKAVPNLPKLRARKTSPLSQPKPASTAAVVSSLPDNEPKVAPDGHTYESWILQEGLIKVRQELKQAKKEKGYCRRQSKNSSRKLDLGNNIQPIGNRGIEKCKTVRFICPVCGKSYGSANGIKYHAENGHGPKSTYTCDICNKEYASRHGLAAHKRSHDIKAIAASLEYGVSLKTQ